MTMHLKTVLGKTRLRQSDLARALGISESAVAQLINHGEWPKRMSRTDIRRRTRDFLSAAGVQPDGDVFAVGEPCNTTARPSPSQVINPTEEDSMLLRKQSLFQATKKHFNLFRDPFHAEIGSADDLYLSPDIRLVREAMFQAARHGGFLGVIAESGAGKTTLLRDLEERITNENQPVVLIKPYVLAMEDNDQKGKTLKASHLAEAIMAAVVPLERVRSSPEARFAQLHKALKDSHAAGYRHCLIIDEAHALPIPTLKHLKRFFELEIGFKKLLSIILIGQPELAVKLSEKNHSVREVVQRCELVELTPLEGPRLDEYLKWKFGRLGKAVDEVIDASGIDAIRERLTLVSPRRDKEPVSLLYPLAVGNLLTAAMNLAAEIGVPVVNADVVRGV
ncbi:MAG: AAA family ATPase [Candidatus Accumulibacter sp.]|jgi:type II secretory pathway predicted ATPase ExeA|nr:AAA family ATPase [Accumulibacter sp.]